MFLRFLELFILTDFCGFLIFFLCVKFCDFESLLRSLQIGIVQTKSSKQVL